MMPVIQILLVCIWNLDFVWTRVFVGCYGVKMKLYFHSKCHSALELSITDGIFIVSMVIDL